MKKKKPSAKITDKSLKKFVSEKTSRKTDKRFKEKIKKEIIYLEKQRTDKVIRYKHPKTKKTVEYTRKNVRQWTIKEIKDIVRENILNNKPEVFKKTRKYTEHIVKHGKNKGKIYKRYIWLNKLTGEKFSGKIVGKKIRSLYRQNIINQLREQHNVSYKKASEMFRTELRKKSWSLMIKKYTPSK